MQWIERLEKQGFVQIDNFLPSHEAWQLSKQIISNNHFKIAILK